MNRIVRSGVGTLIPLITVKVGWNWMWIILGAPWICWALAHLVSALIWQATARVYRLRLPRGVTVEHISQWVGHGIALP